VNAIEERLSCEPVAPFLERILHWFAGHRAVTVAAGAGYFLFSVWSHEIFQELAFRAYDRYDRRRVNAAVQIVGAIGLILLIRWGVRRVRRCERPVRAVAICLTTLGLIAAACKLLLYTDIEVIHLPQYAILAVLVFPLVRQYAETIFLTTLLGAADEGYQYFVTHADWRIHLDFNDVVLNLLGAAVGCLAIYLSVEHRMARQRDGSSLVRRAVSSPTILGTVLIALLATALHLSGDFAFRVDADGSWPRYGLRRCEPSPQFWMTTTWGRRYHELLPESGIALTALLIGLYAVMMDSVPRVGSAKKDATESDGAEC